MECPSCRRENEPTADLCVGCGCELGVASGERRHLTVMFCDLVDSTVLAEALDPEDLADLLRVYHDICTRVIGRHDGYVAQYLGDGVLVYFGFPHAHEDDASRAAQAGLEIVEALGRERRLYDGRTVRLSARVGIHSGPVLVSPRADPRAPHASGHVLNVAARLQAVAEPDSVVVSASTLELIEGRFETQSVGDQALKGIAQPLRVHRLLRPTGVRSRLELAGARGLTPFVGREPEMATLSRCWAEVKCGRGRVVLVQGEPGIGKSRLLEAARTTLLEPTGLWLEGRCSAYHQHSAFFPLVGALEHGLGFEAADGEEIRTAKLRQGLEATGLATSEAIALLAELLSLPLPEDHPLGSWSAEARRRHLLELLTGWLLGIAAQRPVALALEDLHWIDPSTSNLLAAAFDRIAQARVLLVLTARPEFVSPWPEHPCLTRLPLGALSGEPLERMIQALAGGKRVPAEAVRAIADKTDGVPLFVEELTKTLLESHQLRESADSSELAWDPFDLKVPATLVDSLMARLDRLGTARTVAQRASVLGREFSSDLLEAVSPLEPGAVQDALGRLMDAGLVYAQEVPSGATYAFKHSLVRDTAYESLTRPERRRLHQRAAEALLRDPAEIGMHAPELLAHHFEAAGRAQEAARYRSVAGDRALARCAHEEAVHHLKRGLALLDGIDDLDARRRLELDLLTSLGTVYYSTRGYGAEEVARTFGRAWELCEGLGGDIPLKTLTGVWNFRLARADRAGTDSMIPRFRALADRAADPVTSLTGHSVLGIWSFYRGDFFAARDHMAEAKRYYRTPEFQRFALEYGWDGGIYAFAYSMSSLWLLGFPDRAAAARDELLGVAEAAANPYSTAMALAYAVDFANQIGDTDDAFAKCERLTALATEQHLPVALGSAFCNRGRALLRRGEQAPALVQLQTGLALLRAAGVLASYTYYLVHLAEAQLAAGQLEAGLATTDEGLGHCENLLATFHESSLLRVRGELLARRGELSPAREALGKALAVARRQGARALELQAAMSQARLLAERAERNDARKSLAEVMESFGEGFASGDLCEAGRLLRELS